MPERTVRRKKSAFIANESFVMNIGGIEKSFHQGRTRVTEDDEAYKKAPHLFDHLEDHDASQSYE